MMGLAESLALLREATEYRGHSLLRSLRLLRNFVSVGAVSAVVVSVTRWARAGTTPPICTVDGMRLR